jgi:hypothetical protein
MANVRSIGELERLLEKKKDRLKALQKRRDGLAAQLAKIDGEIAALVGKAAVSKGKARRRGRGPKSLERMVVDILTASAGAMTAAEIAEAAEKAGFRSQSKDFVALVRQICYRSKKVQTKERGKFVATAAPKNPRRSRKGKTSAKK